MNAAQGGNSSSSSSSSNSSSVAFIAHTYRGGVGDWIKLHASELIEPNTQVDSMWRVTCDV